MTTYAQDQYEKAYTLLEESFTHSEVMQAGINYHTQAELDTANVKFQQVQKKLKALPVDAISAAYEDYQTQQLDC